MDRHRILPALLAALLICSTLASCGGTHTDTETKDGLASDAPSLGDTLSDTDNTPADVADGLPEADYVPQFIREAIYTISERCAALAAGAGLKCEVVSPSPAGNLPPPSFNLASAIHHVCGGVSAVYESNEGLAAHNAFSAEEILKEHYILFEAILDCVQRRACLFPNA